MTYQENQSFPIKKQLAHGLPFAMPVMSRAPGGAHGALNAITDSGFPIQDSCSSPASLLFFETDLQSHGDLGTRSVLCRSGQLESVFRR